MKRKVLMSAMLLAVVLSAVLSSCSGKYKEMPFGGMNGHVQKVTVWHLMPEMWYAGNRGSDVMYINTSIYDTYGNEICSAVLDSAERVQAEAESLFENGVCVRSTQKAGNKTIARISLVSQKKGTLEYNKEQNGRIVRMTVKEKSFGRRHKSIVSEDGKVVSISEIRTDKDGYPVKIITTDVVAGVKTVQTNKFDEKHNIIEKHSKADNSDEEEVTIIKYGGIDDHGNWTDARTYNDLNLPVEVLVREFEYWE